MRRYISGDELVPGDDGAKKYEHAAVENQVDDRWKGERLRFLGKPAVVRKAYASAESDEEIVGAEDGPDAYAEDGEEQVEDYEGGLRDVAARVGET